MKVQSGNISKWLANKVKDDPIYFDIHRKDLIIKLDEMRSKRSGVDAFIRDLFGVRNYEKMYSIIKKADENFDSNFKKSEKKLEKLEKEFKEVVKYYREKKVKPLGCSYNEETIIRCNLWRIEAYPQYLSNFKDCKSWLSKEENGYQIKDIDISEIPNGVEPEIIFGYAPYLFLKSVSEAMSFYLNKGKTDARKAEIQLLFNKVSQDISRIEYSTEEYGQESKAVQEYFNSHGDYKSVFKKYGKLD